VRLERAWAEPVEVPDGWDAAFRLARYPLSVYWSDSQLFPCDKHGFRIPPGVASVREQHERTEGRRRVFCIGGSTTFGWLCPYEDSFPARLERLLDGAAVFNLGLLGLDSKAALHLFVDLLRWGLVPDVAVFLDGINEKQGWLQAIETDRQGLEEVDRHYEYFRRRMEQAPARRLSLRRGSVDDDVIPPRLIEAAGGERGYLRLVPAQRDAYLGARAAIERIAAAWGIETRFFLQPTVWDVWKGEAEPRYEYLKALYRSILAHGEGVVDLSHASLEPVMFLDWQHLDGAGNEVVAVEVARGLSA
jgi:hypothetical protein